MTIDEARNLLDYNVWANARMFDAVEPLASDRLTMSVASSFPSIRATIGHIVVAEWVWLRRWLGESPGAAPAWATESSLAELKAKLERVEAERAAFIGGLTDADLDGVVGYRFVSGEAHSDPLGDLIRHVVNHAAYHRGQVATQLRQVGHTPFNTDLITYLHRRS